MIVATEEQLKNCAIESNAVSMLSKIGRSFEDAVLDMAIELEISENGHARLISTESLVNAISIVRSLLYQEHGSFESYYKILDSRLSSLTEDDNVQKHV
jgi:hypothetical protein